jgi:hypothetical protein
LGSPAPVTVKNTTGQNDVAVFVRGSNGGVYSRELINATWSDWVYHGTPPTGDSGSPAVVSKDAGFIDVIIRDPHYGRLYHRQRNVFGWGADWTALPFTGVTFANPHIAAAGPAFIQIFSLNDAWPGFGVINQQWQFSTGWVWAAMVGDTVY